MMLLFKAGLYITIVLHWAFVLILTVSIPVVLYKGPWYISFPIVSWLINLPRAMIKCPLTELENYFRKQLGLPKIKGFLSHYIKKKGSE